jgi:hypothetical protein
VIGAATMMACGAASAPATGEARVVFAQSALAADGILSMTLTVAPGSVAGQDTFAPFSVEMGPVAPWAVHYSGIPAGLGRVLTLDAMGAGIPPAPFRGSALADVPAGGTVDVIIPLQPLVPATPVGNSAPVVDSLTIDGVAVPIGSTVSLGASAHDPDPGDVVSYLWSVPATCGLFADTGRPETVRPITFWSAPADPRTCRLTLQVSDGRGASVSVYADVVVQP